MDAFARHRADLNEARLSGDPDRIKDAYRRLGRYLEEENAEDLDAVPVLSFEETTPVVAAHVPPSAGVVLDAGCGPNPSLAITLAATSHRVVALDIALGSVRLARTIGERTGAHLLAVVGDVERLPFRDAAFDAVVCDDTIEHLPDDRGGAAELGRVACRDGTVIVATPNRHSLAVVAHKARDRLRGRRLPASAYYVADSHLREYTRRELARRLDGLIDVERYATVGWGGGALARWATRAVSVPPFRGMTRVVVAVGRPAPRVSA